MARRAVRITLDESVLRKLDARLSGGNRSRYIEALVCLDFEAPPPSGGDARTARAQADADAKLSSLLDQALADRLARDPATVIDALDPKTLANLVARRSPKPQDQDAELTQSYLQLSESLRQTASIPDITQELSKARHRIEGLKAELELSRKEVIFMRAKITKEPGAWEKFREALGTFAERCRAYARDAEDRGLELDDLRPLIIYPGKEQADGTAAD
jgi:hypothetical protein